MKKSYLVLFPLVALFSLTSCVSDPNSAEVISKDVTEVSNHTTLQQGLMDAEMPGSYIFLHDLELGTFSNSAPTPISFSWSVKTDNNAVAKNYQIYFSENEEFTSPIKYTVAGLSFKAYNLKIRTKYYYKVIANYKTKSYESEVKSFTTSLTAPRNLYVDGVENVRDLGGYELENGKVLKQGLIYRTAQFNYDKSDEKAIKSKPTSKGLNTLLNELKIKTDVDVREKSNKSGKDETLGIKSSPLGKSVNYIYLPMRYGGTNIFTNEMNTESIKSFFELCADSSNYPIAFHCVRGTDRTGALAYALGALCGMSEDDLMKDYLFSNFANIGSLLKENSISGTSFYPSGISNSSGDTISEKAMNYLMENVGVSRTTLEAIIENLTE